jgi:hypothetical protein
MLNYQRVVEFLHFGIASDFIPACHASFTSMNLLSKNWVTRLPRLTQKGSRLGRVQRVKSIFWVREISDFAVRCSTKLSYGSPMDIGADLETTNPVSLFRV